jgi:hypothetical protein
MRGHKFNCSLCMHIYFCDLGYGIVRSSLDDHDLCKRDDFLGGSHGSYLVRATNT